MAIMVVPARILIAMLFMPDPATVKCKLSLEQLADLEKNVSVKSG